MSRRIVNLVFVLVCSIAYAWAQNDAPARARYELNQGVAAYKNVNYEQAIEHFGNAVRLDPELIVARLYLATAYRSQYIPGVDAPDNVEMANEAVAQYSEVLRRQPDNVNSLQSMAWLYMQMKKFVEAKDYYRRALAMDSKNPELYYSVAFMDWAEVYQSLAEERAKMNLKTSQTLIFDTACRAIRAKNLPLVEDGLAMLAKAVSLREDYDDAMAYMNLLYRSRSDLECGDKAAYKDDLRQADEWVDLAMATRRKKAAAAEKANGGPVIPR